MVLSPVESPQQAVDAIAFNVAAAQWPEEDTAVIEIGYRMDINEFRGKQSLQLMIEQILALD